ncbi:MULTISPECIES: class I SAM-dependent DNA methyltransferase [unclassified Burkholderia]|uniref:class I SAM-dependent DNA methyltransferase n=1 Tax=unclassified Burkholderia TaxID=2613784 RepID=UPI002ABD9740|nr:MULTISPECIES: N-6 DNA methylase [unclassified Burkholderia]
MSQKIGAALLSYAETIWKTADTLRGAGIKEGDFPSYMMPFFALMLLESRLRRFRAEKIAQFEKAMGMGFDFELADHREWLEASARAENKGFHPELLLLGKGLKETCAVPGGNFRGRLLAHLELYDTETKRLLGLGYPEGAPKYLDIQGKASDLFSRPNSPLYAFASRWAAIDLTPFTNSEVTTIEEHIKRRWGDISAETAGEQYTPSDVIDLAADLIVSLRKEGSLEDGVADVYDMACGGGNFLFATEDALRQAFPRLSVRTRGQELNDALYALAAIEARFREDSRIEHENTLTNDLFLSEKFDVIVANPPYGSDWKDFRFAIESDASGRFSRDRLPPISDGQLLFLQHAAFHLAEQGVATIVHNGSTLFSGGAGSGESQTRLWLLKEQDLVEAIIQLPRGEFFNTDISTYMWVLNRNKPRHRSGRVLLINAEDCGTKLERNLNKKNCKISSETRETIVRAFEAYADGPLSKVLTIDQLLYNDVEIEVHRHDEEGRAIQEPVELNCDELELSIDDRLVKIVRGVLDDAESIGSTPVAAAATLNEWVKRAASIHLVASDGNQWRWDVESGRLTEERVEGHMSLGLGRVSVKAKVSKSKKSGEVVKVTTVIGPLLEKDHEITAFSSDPSENDRFIEEFLNSWVREPRRRLGQKLGCEINFNRFFPKRVHVPSSEELANELEILAREMTDLQAALEAVGGRRRQ